MGDKSARRPNNPKEDQLLFGQSLNCVSIALQSMIPKLIFMLIGEQLILNLLMSHQRTKPEIVLNKPKLLITRLTNALNG